MRDFNIELVLIYEGLARSFHELICLNKVDIPNRSRAVKYLKSPPFPLLPLQIGKVGVSYFLDITFSMFLEYAGGGRTQIISTMLRAAWLAEAPYLIIF